jgi:hypothetical protein
MVYSSTLPTYKQADLGLATPNSVHAHEPRRPPELAQLQNTETLVVDSAGSLETGRENHQYSPDNTASEPLSSTSMRIETPNSLSRSGIDGNASHLYSYEQHDPLFVASDTTLNTRRVGDTLTIDTPSHAGITPVFTVLPAHVAATCPLDQILLGFLSSRRDMISEGMPADVVVGPLKASVKALVHTELATDVHPLSRVMSEVLSTYPMVGTAERMALFHLMHQTMRVGTLHSSREIELTDHVSGKYFPQEKVICSCQHG